MEFKTETLEFLLHGDKTVVKVGRDLGLRIELLYRWGRKYSNDQNHFFPGTGNLQDPEEERISKMERELRSVREEPDILKPGPLKKKLLSFKYVPSYF